jgi:hypothetical protein
MNTEQFTDLIERLKQIEIYLAQLVGRSRRISSRIERRGNAEPKG